MKFVMQSYTDRQSSALAYLSISNLIIATIIDQSLIIAIYFEIFVLFFIKNKFFCWYLHARENKIKFSIDYWWIFLSFLLIYFEFWWKNFNFIGYFIIIYIQRDFYLFIFLFINKYLLFLVVKNVKRKLQKTRKLFICIFNH